MLSALEMSDTSKGTITEGEERKDFKAEETLMKIVGLDSGEEEGRKTE